jgi:Putative zinc-finger
MAGKKFETMCKELEEDLVLYYYGEIADKEKRRLEQHLGGCGGCGRFIEELHRLLPQMALPEELPQSFWDDYYRETIAKLRHQREQKFYWRNLFVPMRTWMIPAFGTAIIAALAFGVVLSKGSLSSLYNQSQERIPNEIVTDTEQLEFFRSLDMLEALSGLEGLETSKADAHAA